MNLIIVEALRGLRRRPRLALLMAACIALGVAAVGATLTLVYAVTLKPLPFPDGERLVRVWVANERDPRVNLSIPELADLEGVKAFDAFAGTARSRMVAWFEDGAMRLRGEGVTPRYLELIGVQPRLGRAFHADDFKADAPAVAIVSDLLWRTRLGADPAVVGRTLTTAVATFEIIGVMPPGFQGTVESDEVEVWMPLPKYQPAMLITARGARQSYALARLAPGVTREQAQAEVTAMGATLAAQWPVEYERFTWSVEAVGENWKSGLRANAWLLFGAAAALLLVALVNVVGLALARAVDRRREFAVRAALGASAGRVAALLFAEGAVIALIGAVAGALSVPLLLKLFVASAPVDLPKYLSLTPDPLTILLLAVVCGGAALFAGLLPARLADRADVQAALRDGGRGQAGGRLARHATRGLVVTQVGLSVLLLVVGGLLLRSFMSLERADLGFRTDIVRLAMSLSSADSGGDVPALRQRVRDALAAEPGVQAVGLVWSTLPPWNSYSPVYHHASMGAEPTMEGARLNGHAVDSGFFDMMGMRLIAGRNIGSQDGPDSEPVVVISASLAAELGGAERVIGTELRNMFAFQDNPDSPARARIVGVVSDVAWDGYAEQDTGRLIRWDDATDPATHRRDAYWSLAQVRSGTLSIGVRMAGDQTQALQTLKRRLGEVAPRSAVQWDSLMTDELARESKVQRFAAALTVAFATSALALAALGLFAVIANGVARRQNEFGVRMALGATPARVLRTVLDEGLGLAALGVVLGCLAAFAAARVLSSLLHGVSGADPLAYAGAAGTALTVAALACWWPARRAAATDPMTALRSE
jgi:putative ABC transport system permease protein